MDPGSALKRQAKAILMIGPTTVEAVVDIGARTLTSWREVPGVQPDITAEELQMQDGIAKSSPEVLAALKRRGITDLTTVECLGLTRGYFAIAEEGRARSRGVLPRSPRRREHLGPAGRGPHDLHRPAREEGVSGRRYGSSRCQRRPWTCIRRRSVRRGLRWRRSTSRSPWDPAYARRRDGAMDGGSFTCGLNPAAARSFLAREPHGRRS